MKKLAWGFLAAYGLYIAVMAGYFFVWTKEGIPADVKGTAADPSLFMTHSRLVLSQEYNRVQHFLYFLSYPLDWGIYLFVLIFGFSRWLRQGAEKFSRWFVVQTAVYFVALSLLAWAVSLPIDILRHEVSLHFGISIQDFPDWFKEQLLSFAVDALFTLPATIVILYFIRRSPKRWWLPVWLLSIPFIVFLMYIQPVVIDPLFNHFYSLRDGTLKHEILGLAERADIPANNVYEVDMSKKTNALNAYVNGIGSNLRIVLWDTTVERLDHREVLFIMAHEMGHYVMHHLFWGMVGSIAMMLAGLYLSAKGLLRIVSRWGPGLNIHHPGDLAALPILLLLFSLLSFAGTPIENAVSRHYEHAADNYAVHLTKDKAAGISAFQKLSNAGLGEMNPPALVKWMIYDHPTMMERIEFLEHVKLTK